ncbi:MAG: alpha/beta hydrolase-fold protein [Caulobacterales bacterium]
MRVRTWLAGGAASAAFGLGLLDGAGAAAATPAPFPPAVAAPAVSPAVQEGSQQFVVHSAKVGRDFTIVVTPPQTPALPGQKQPAIYALDSGYGIAGQIARLSGAAAGMSGAYVVSVGYGEGQTNDRNTDLTHHPFPSEGGQTVGGGGPAFEAFLLEELRPQIEARYPADPNQAILFGHSLGGLFVANVLADNPQAFRAYIIGSPSVWADPTVVARVAAAAANGGGRRVYVSVGEKESAQMTDGAAQLTAALSKPGSTFVVKERVFAGENHLSYYPQLASLAFAYVLPPPPIPPERHEIAVDAATLAHYVGVYRLTDGRTVTVTIKDGKLFAQLTGLPQIQLFAETAHAFFVKGVDAQMTFKDNGSAPSESAVVHLNGGDANAVRAP